MDRGIATKENILGADHIPIHIPINPELRYEVGLEDSIIKVPA